MNVSRYRILIVDDEPDIVEFLSYNLKKEGFQIQTASNGREAIERAIDFRPHLILLDVMMPDMDGIETCEQLRKQPSTSNTLIAFLTARSEDYSQIAGFDAGGDDYITKPIKPKVLISRIKALLKRSGTLIDDAESPDTIPAEGIYIDKERYSVYVNGNELSLPKKEFELLALLYSRPQKVFTRDEIYQAV
ncbi:MAG: response regulator transcription factor, partial [Bacteroidales bacterium]|nr:response regulator transcription factor [Bacteroidales bacterium]